MSSGKTGNRNREPETEQDGTGTGTGTVMWMRMRTDTRTGTSLTIKYFNSNSIYTKNKKTSLGSPPPPPYILRQREGKKSSQFWGWLENCAPFTFTDIWLAVNQSVVSCLSHALRVSSRVFACFLARLADLYENNLNNIAFFFLALFKGYRFLTINEWGRVSHEELCRSRGVLSVEAVGRGGEHTPRSP